MEQKKQLTLKEVLCLSEQERKEITRKNLKRVLTEFPLLVEKMPQIKRDFGMGIYGVFIKD